MNELYHHGVKGQKWGVRRWQNEDGSWKYEGNLRRRTLKDQKIRKKQKLYRYTAKEETLSDLEKKEQMYVSNDPHAYADELPWVNYLESYRDTYTLTGHDGKDAVIAGTNTVNDILKSLGEKELSEIEFEYSRDENKGTDRDFMSRNPELAKKTREELKKRGYSGMIDPYDLDIIFDYETTKPYIIVDGIMERVEHVPIKELW